MLESFSKSPTISVIIPCYNEEKYIGACLESVFASTYKDIEVIVIDDASTDSTVKIAELFPCKIMKLDKNSGVANAKNIGISQAKSEIMYILDADAVIERHSLEKVHELLTRNQALSGVNGFWSHRPLNKGLFPQYQALDMYFRMASQLKTGYSFYWGNGSAIRKTVFLKSGGFNTSYLGAGCEDYEITFRIPKEEKFLVSPDVEIYHTFPHFFFDGIKKYLRRSILFIDALVYYRANDNFYTTGRNFVNFISFPVLLVLLCFSYFYRIPSWMLTLPIGSFLLTNLSLYRFVYRKEGMFFTFYFIATSFVVSLVINVGATIGILRYLFVRRRMCSSATLPVMQSSSWARKSRM